MSELVTAISQAGGDGVCCLKGDGGNSVALILGNLAIIEAVEEEVLDS